MRCRSCRPLAHAARTERATRAERGVLPAPRAPHRCASTQDSPATSKSLHLPSEPRFSEIGVQHLSRHVHAQVFPGQGTRPPPELVALARDHLTRHELLGKNQDSTAPVAFDLPPLQGASLDEHFHRLGMDAAEPFLGMAKKLAWANPPPKPRRWLRQSGWTKYHADGTAERVAAPDESMLTFDTEVMYKETSFACMACAVSPTAWYAWLSPWLLGESASDRHLIPLGDPAVPRIVVGHNIGYDRARIAEEYDIRQSKNCFIDTMSLHVASNGMCSRQRPSWMKHKKSRDLRDKIATADENAELSTLLDSGAIPDEEEELWIGRSAVNSLRDVAKFHCNITIDKAQREYFGELDRPGIREKLDELLDYCAADVEITHRVYQKVFPLFIETCPHPVSFAALRFMAAEILPVNETWDAYINNAEATYQTLNTAVRERLVALADKALEVKDQPDVYNNDPWLRQLDWSGQEVKMVKGKKKNDPPRPSATQKMPGMPQWYKDLFPKKNGPMNLTIRTRVAPILLRLAWDGNPLIWSDVYGWTYQVPMDEVFAYNEKGLKELDMMEEQNLKLRDDRQHVYYKIPHKDGPQARCSNPLAKNYLQYFEKGTLSSEYAYAKEALEMNASCSYWISARDRIMSQMTVYSTEVPDTPKLKSSSGKGRGKKVGFILPQLIPMGTITRRAVENTWLTASNAKKNRVGSELKSMIRAPQGYCFVGADVDSEELWIASLVGDATFQLHGGNAVGFMTLEGTKAAGTDLHSRTAGILGISRNDAKVFNYGRIYGAGLKFAATLLRQFNPGLTDAQTTDTANALYLNTKGKKTTRKQLHERPFWRGGTESFVFNKLEDFAEQERPRTPVLGAAITEALQRRYLTKGGFMTSRINWAIQSSGVDYLHLLIIGMDYLARRYNIDARLSLTVHDEIRYLVKETDKYRAAMAMQIANLWTRAMFAQQMGINELPQSCAYFSAVDIDHVLRKEVDMDCVTPSHSTPIPHGESLDIVALLDKGTAAFLDPKTIPTDPPQPHLHPHVFRDATPDNETVVSESMLGDADFADAPFADARKRKRGADQMSLLDQQHQIWADQLLDYFMLLDHKDAYSWPEPPPSINLDRPIDEKGHAAMHWAAAMGDVGVVKELIHRGARIDCLSNNLETPLMRAVMFTNNFDKETMPSMVKIFQQTVHRTDWFGSTVFHHIAATTSSSNKYVCARWYLDCIINKLSETWIPDEVTRLLNAADQNGDTAVMIAARNGARKCVRSLLGRNVSVDVPNKKGETADDLIRDLNSRRRMHGRPRQASSSPFAPPPEHRLNGFGTPLDAGPLLPIALPNARHARPEERAYRSQTASHLMTKVAPTLVEKCEELALAYEHELAEKEAESFDASRVVKRRQAELEAIRKQVSELESRERDLDDEGVDVAQEQELRDLVTEAESLLEVEQKSELRRLLGTIPSDPASQNSSAEDPKEKLRLSLLLYRAQLERRELVRAVVANLSVAGMSEKQAVYKGLIAKALGEREDDVESMLPEILRELEEAQTQERAEGLEGSPL